MTQLTLPARDTKDQSKPFRKPPRQTSRIAVALVAVVAATLFPATSFALDPVASASAPNVTTAGDTLYVFTVLYVDDGPVVDDFTNDDVHVTGPNGFERAARFVIANYNEAGNAASVTYSIVPPGGSWDSGDNGSYTVVMQANRVHDLIGNYVAAGNIGSFTVTAPGPPAAAALGNISTRLRVETGDNILIGGFIITGTQPKKIMVRAIGSSLPFADKLADPTLEFYQGNTLLESNDNWNDSPNRQAIIDTTIAPTNAAEAAILRTVNPGAYTAIVRGVGGGTGIAVVEVYDLETGANSKLANISSRGAVQTGDNVLFAGMIVLGSGTQKVIVRALGPSVPVPGAMSDPNLALHDSNGALLESNDNWIDSPNKQAIIDTTIAPTNNQEAAILRTLTPGNYTAIVRGTNNATGVSVVEVYALN